MTEKPAPSGDLRDQTAEALPCPVCPAQAGEPCHRAREGNQQPHMSRLLRADAVLPVVRSALAAAERRAEQAEAERDALQHRLNVRADALADERRGRLAAHTPKETR